MSDRVTAEPSQSLFHAAARLGPLVSLLVLTLAFIALDPNFLSRGNFQDIVVGASVLLIVASASTFVILLGCIDLSVGAVVTVSAIVSAQFAPQLGVLAFAPAIAVGLTVGLTNGLLHVGLRIPSFLVTLGMMTSLGGVSLILTKGAAVPVLDEHYLAASRGMIVPGIENLFVWAIAIHLVLIWINRRTLFGRHVMAVGGGERVASLIGLNVGACKISAFALSGAVAGLAGALLAARLGTAAVGMGDSLMLDAITAIVLGGTFVTGGSGSVARTLVGVLLTAVLSNGLNILAVNPDLQQVIKGVVILAAVVVMNDRRIGAPK
jgi:ribose/xylose/arabinose/galactoside ABC-type transport system permease subunit